MVAGGLQASGLLRQLRDPFVEFGDGLADLLLAGSMRREFELALHLGARQAAGLELTGPLRVAALRGLSCLLLFLFAFFHALGEAGLRVDEPFSGVTHASNYTDLLAR